MGLMGGRNYISNIEITGKDFLMIRDVLNYYFGFNNNIEKILYVIKGKSVYEVVIDEIISFRLDIRYLHTKRESKIKLYNKKIFYQKFAHLNGVNVPEVFGVNIFKEKFFKVSEWIKGVRVGYVWNDPDMFFKAGREVAKINCLKDPHSDFFLGYNDFSKPNAIWTKNEEVYLVDVEIGPKKSVDGNVAKLLLKNVKDRDKIICFLNGYNEIRDCSKINKILERRNYKW